jgi:uncharacterized membrane protein
MQHATEARLRSLAKAVLWRTISSILTFFVIYFTTDNLHTSFKLTLVIMFLTTIGYYVHERIWTRIMWGNGIHLHKSHTQK